MAHWYKHYNEIRQNAFSTQGQYISAVQIKAPDTTGHKLDSMLSKLGSVGKKLAQFEKTFGSKALCGEFVVTRKEGNGIEFNLYIPPGTPKSKEVVMWGTKLAGEAPGLTSLSLARLKAIYGQEGAESIAKRVLEVNPNVQIRGITLPKEMTSTTGKHQLHVNWCQAHNIAYGQTPNIEKLALDPDDVFPHPHREERQDVIHVRPPQPHHEEQVHIRPPNDLAAVVAQNIPDQPDPNPGPNPGPDPDPQNPEQQGGPDDPDVLFGNRPR